MSPRSIGHIRGDGGRLASVDRGWNDDTVFIIQIVQIISSRRRIVGLSVLGIHQGTEAEVGVLGGTGAWERTQIAEVVRGCENGEQMILHLPGTIVSAHTRSRNAGQTDAHAHCAHERIDRHSEVDGLIRTVGTACHRHVGGDLLPTVADGTVSIEVDPGIEESPGTQQIRHIDRD